MDRRSFLRTTATGAAGAASLLLIGAGRPTQVFQHGVAAGDPLPERLLLWTRVTPTPTATPGSGRGAPVEVRWEVARDTSFRTIVAAGTVTTTSARDHTVKVDATGLRPNTEYAYRFHAAGRTSPVGRARTAPGARSPISRLRMGVVSCSNMAAGFFTAYGRLADRDDLQCVLHLGDYLYEYGTGEYGAARAPDPPHEIVTLADYRRRHAQYKTDPDLQRLHARHAFVCTWDDHEVANDAWRDGADNHQDGEGAWARRAAAARRAYFEWMPIREPAPGTTRIYRTLRFGTLAQLQMADLRQYRDQQASSPLATTEVHDPGRTLLGDEQERWLHDGLRSAGTAWKLLGSSVMMTPVTFGGLPDLPLVDGAVRRLLGGATAGVPLNVDAWDGYAADQQALLRLLGDEGIEGFVSLVGDIHSAWACELAPSVGAPPVGVELVCSSVTSDNVDEVAGTAGAIVAETALMATNPDVRMVELRGHGFSVLELTPEAAQMDWWEVDPHVQGGSATWARSWRTIRGTNRLEQMAGPVR